MFRFENIVYAWTTPLVFLLFGVLAYIFYRKRMWIIDRLGARNIIEALMPKIDVKMYIIGALITALCGALMYFSLSNPQYGEKKSEVSAESADIFIAFDISQSMLTQDVRPSRLERAKRFAQDLVEEVKGNRIGLVFFAGEAYLQMPLTGDHAAALSAIRSADTRYAGLQGTNFKDAISKAMNSFQEGDEKSRALIIISDGENHEPDAIDMVQEAKEDGMITFTIGVGTEKGAYVPEIVNGRERYKKDKAGNPVISKFDPEMMRSLAHNGGGAFYMVEDGSKAIDNLELRLSAFSQSEKSVRSFDEKRSYYQYILLLALGLMVFSWSPFWRNKKYAS